MDVSNEADASMEQPQKCLRLTEVNIHQSTNRQFKGRLLNVPQDIEPQLGQEAEEHLDVHPSLIVSLPSPDPTTEQCRPTRTRRFPRRYEEFEATSYSPIPTIPQVGEEAFECRIEPPVEPAALSTPDMSVQSSNRSQPNRYHVFRVHTAPSTTSSTIQSHIGDCIQTPPHPHPFKNDTIFEFLKERILGPNPKSLKGMDEQARLIASGKFIPEELVGFSSKTELQRLDKFAAKSDVAGGPFKTGSVKIKMLCGKANKPKFTVEANAPEFEVSGIQYRSLVDIITSGVQDPSLASSFVHTPFTEWWRPPGSSTPIQVYGEAYSSDTAVRLYKKIKGIQPPESDPQVESVVVLLKLGSDATLLANHGTAALWPIYVFFGNLPKDDSSKPSGYDVAHLAYLPKVIPIDSSHVQLLSPPLLSVAG